MCQNLFNIKPNQLYVVQSPPINSYVLAPSVLAHSKMENKAKGKTSKCTIKKNIVNYNDQIICTSSTTIVIKRKSSTYCYDLSLVLRNKNKEN